MRKGPLIGLILFLATLVGLYQMRIQLLTTAFNRALENSDIRLLRLAGLEFGWDGLAIEELVLGVGENNARQSLQQVYLEYSLVEIRPRRLTASRVILNLPDTSEPATDSRAETGPLLSELAGQLLASPLESIAISALEVDGSPLLSQPLQLQASWDGPHFSLLAQDRDKQLSLQLQRSGPDQLLLTSQLERDDQRVIQFTATVSHQGDQQQLQGEGRLAVAGLAALMDLPEPVTTATGELVFQLSGLLDDDLSVKSAEAFLVTLSGEGLALQLEDGEEATILTGIKLQLSSQLTLDDKQLTATLAPGELVRVESLVQGDIKVNQPALIADSAGTVNYQLDSSSVRLQVDRMQLLLPQAEMPQMNLATRLGLSGLEIVLDAKKPLRGSIHLSADSINLQRPGVWLPALAFEADVALDRQLVRINGQVYSDERKPLFTLSADYQLQTERGSGRILADTISFDADSNRLSRYFAHWPFDWDLYQGNVMLDVGVTWRSVGEGTEIHGKISQRLERLAGVYEEIGFIGLDGDFEADFSSPDQLLTTRAATLSLETLEVGVPIEAIRAHFLVDAAQQQLTLQTVEAELFGGRVWTEGAVYRAGSTHNRIDIGVDGLQLGQLLALAGYDAVEGSGRISGLLPVDVSATGVIMERGMLAARAPGGVLRYRAEVSADTNPSLASVIEALSNYQYSIFQVEADYLENGDLLLEMLLRGRNPDYEQGRPIHLNLNVTDNIPVLLKSLQAGRVIADTISKKLGGSP